jgi:hypothetical protein
VFKKFFMAMVNIHFVLPKNKSPRHALGRCTKVDGAEKICSCHFSVVVSRLTFLFIALWQAHHKRRELPFLRFHFDLAFVFLYDDAVADRQAQARALSGWLRGKEEIENFFANVRWNSVAVVADAAFPFIGFSEA